MIDKCGSSYSEPVKMNEEEPTPEQRDRLDKETEFFAQNPSLEEISDFNKKLPDAIATQTLTEDLSSVADL